MFPLRDSTRSETFPYVTVFLIVLNLFVYFQESLLSPDALYRLLITWGMVPAALMQPDTLFHAGISFYTAMFLHGSWTHVIGNMWMLWLFGDNVEDRMGHARYLLFYFIGGTVASATHCLIFPTSEIPVVGASGAVAGIMGAYFMLFKRASILTWILPFFFVRIPAVFYLGLWAVLQFLSGAMDHSEAGNAVAFWAHIGGFVAGMFLFRFFLKNRQPEHFI